MNSSSVNLKIRIARAVLACVILCTTTPCFSQDATRGIVAENPGTVSGVVERPDPEIRFQLGHQGDVNSVAWSPNGKYIVSGSDDYTVKVWDATSGKELRTLSGHSADVNSVAWSPNGKYIASGSDDYTVKVWDATSGKELRTLSGHSADVNSVAWSPDGKYITSGSSDDTVKVWDATSGKELRTLSGHSENVESVVWSPDGKCIASGSGDYTEYGMVDGTVKVWDAVSGKELRTFYRHSGRMNSMSWSPDGKRIASGSGYDTVKVWDISSGKELQTLSVEPDVVHSVAWSPDGKYIASGSWDGSVDGMVKIWDAVSGKELHTLSGHSWSVNSVAWSPDSKRIASGNGDNTVKVWDVSSGKELRTLPMPSNWVKSITWSPDGKYIASYGDDFDFAVKVSDTTNGKVLRTLTGHSDRVESVAWSPNGKYIVSSSGYFSESRDNTVRVWDVANGKEMHTFYSKFPSAPWSPNGKYIAIVIDNTITVYDAKSRKKLSTLTGHSYKVNSVTWSPDSKYIASGSDDGTVRVWDVDSGMELNTLLGHSGWVSTVTWSPNGKYISSCSNYDGTVRIWDVDSGKEMHTFYSNSAFASWSPNGKYIANCSDDNTITVWDADSGMKLNTLSGHSSFLYSVSWSPNGRFIASGSYDDTIKIWDVDSGMELSTLQGHSDNEESVAWSPNSEYIASGGNNTIKIWDAQLGTLLSTTINGKDGEWLTYTPEGFFCGSEWATKNLVYIVDGMDVIGIDQVYDAYYRPDLVAAKIRGEDISSYASSVQLASLVRSGSAPLISFSDIPSESSGRDMAFGVSVRNTGGGIGAVNLLLNGKAIRLSDGVASKDGETVVFHHTVTLQNGSNTLEAFALNGAGLVESVRANAEVVWRGATEKPDLYVLTVAVNKYRDKSLWLNYAVPDAEAIAGGFQKQKSGLYRNVHISQLNDGEVTKENLASAFSRLSQSIRADDVFVFFVSGHGTTYDDGDYYYLPADFRYTSKDSIPDGGISKNDLLANLSKIKAGKTLVMLDTCNSGAFLSDFGQRGLSEKTAIDRLTRATGHATLAASSDTQAAMEGYNGHGVFTYVLLEGISGAADSDGDGYVTLNELSAFVEKEVPERSYEKWGYEQVPQKDLRRQDFPIAGK